MNKKNIIVKYYSYCLIIILFFLFYTCDQSTNLKNENIVNDEERSVEIEICNFPHGECTHTENKGSSLVIDQDITIISTNSEDEINIGDLVFAIEFHAMVVEKRNLNADEKLLLAQLNTLLKENNISQIREKLERKIVRGYKRSYYDENRTQVASTNLYSKTLYYLKRDITNGGDLLDFFYSDNWKYENPLESPIYTLLAVDFTEGLASNLHTSSLYVEQDGKQYPNIPDAVKTVLGTITLESLEEMSFGNGIENGRIKFIEGDVSINDTSSSTSNISGSIPIFPVHIDKDIITLNFFTEDGNNYDYQDSFITVKIIKNPIISIADDNWIEVIYNEEAQIILGGINILDLKISYKDYNSEEGWILVGEDQLQVDTNKGIWRLNIPVVYPEFELLIGPR